VASVTVRIPSLPTCNWTLVASISAAVNSASTRTHGVSASITLSNRPGLVITSMDASRARAARLSSIVRWTASTESRAPLTQVWARAPSNRTLPGSGLSLRTSTPSSASTTSAKRAMSRWIWWSIRTLVRASTARTVRTGSSR